MLLELVVRMLLVLKGQVLDGQVLFCQWDKFRNLSIGQLLLFMSTIPEPLLLLGLGVKIPKLIPLVLRTITLIHV